MAKVQIEQEDGYIIVIAPYDEDWRDRAKELGGYWDSSVSGWAFDEDTHTVRDIEREVKLFFPGAFR